MTSSFLHESYSSSVDFPTYIPWQTLSTDLSDKLKQGSIRINRSNRVEYATITEETPGGGERIPLINGTKAEVRVVNGFARRKSVTPAVRGGTSWAVASFLLVNSALGAGVLNYPAAYEKAGGIVIATIMQVFLMTVLASTMLVLAYCADLNKVNTYHDILMAMCGKKAQQLSAMSIMLTCYCVCITFLIVIGDQYDRLFFSLFGSDFCTQWYMDRKFTISITATLFILPMCYFQRLDFLRYAGTLGVFAMIYIVCLTVYEYFMLVDVEPGVIRTKPANLVNVFVVIPVICFAYQTHEIVVPLYACMENRNLQDFTKAVIASMAILFGIYCVAGTFGYLTFGSIVAPDIMQMYNAKDPVVLLGMAALVIKMITTYPPLVVCGRGALDGLYAEFTKLPSEKFISGEMKRRIIITTGWFFTSLFFAIATPNIGIVIELLGCLASLNVFIFPGLCLVSRVLSVDPDLKYIRSIMLLVLSSIMLVLGTFVFGVVLSQVILVELMPGGATKLAEKEVGLC